jgi:hypothetical protein
MDRGGLTLVGQAQKLGTHGRAAAVERARALGAAGTLGAPILTLRSAANLTLLYTPREIGKYLDARRLRGSIDPLTIPVTGPRISYLRANLASTHPLKNGRHQTPNWLICAVVCGERHLRRILAGYAGRDGRAEVAGRQGACAGVAAGRGWSSGRWSPGSMARMMRPISRSCRDWVLVSGSKTRRRTS